MWVDFKNYQENAIVKLRREINELLDSEGDKICIFKAPTGSGKTLMMAEWMMRFCDPFSRTDGKRFSFIWIAVNKLHDQSYDTLKKFYADKGLGLKCSYFHELDERKIGQNEILFLNWASVNKGEKGVITRANERAEGLSKYIATENKKGKNLFGGIALKDKNSWRYHDSKRYDYNPNNLKDWKFLDLN